MIRRKIKKGKHMSKDLSALDLAGAALYDQGFQDGVASVPAQPAQFTQADLDAAVAKAKSDAIASVQALLTAEDADLAAKVAAL